MALRYFLYRIIAFCGLIFLIPVLCVLYIIVKLDSKGPFIFTQKRMGKGKKPFTLYKIRTMVVGAEKQQKKLLHLNEVDGPVFKIRHDPRYTKVGKKLSHYALDEILQLINVMRGEMSLIGPRPLPMEEALLIPKQYQARFSVLPGMTSEWIVKGAHDIPFDKWMKMDVEYAKNPSFGKDIKIFIDTSLLIIKLLIKR
ncbi:hypothetical protein A2334_01680 [Candidatus Roizmanbacteria bacterium RIFOXYB2_FULL_38_10]|uniref:Bacterial sugar transferase domain-containing protein n=1 Tax=Candidatus Roizmanbacteria bacterium RIFOXYD1_FULL_38_12 TaxID=1802093 RepID=A0A1F7L1R7_9BACT|nr:MAG: hypothetical protein A3K47_04740 [Candidatus Roizmanbacteria bacterium RIFOXYA2_FULL_38_14]OGK64058.1 MAG: hypothetical protein A3K27_04740 [Candidatus Roizmanbacteria bacterium RIFOXYA1_FULL_37_12]OGK65904.1 MAG: hypothetical protein A3K38_04740 [Candidatus Roizmanbacteria bacterium RIFOXYB1_FULL_40_23]OGK68057.1 MAG: hypothetical protein A2334_01680 [Candidatus Roizmanbacteria bacterium RIFOXYB2_FULL_38_10]OGK70309.1 MAG: hypothetical protein A3K21_04745 [Candidatus Roizmanbacteria ba